MSSLSSQLLLTTKLVQNTGKHITAEYNQSGPGEQAKALSK